MYRRRKWKPELLKWTEQKDNFRFIEQRIGLGLPFNREYSGWKAVFNSLEIFCFS